MYSVLKVAQDHGITSFTFRIISMLAGGLLIVYLLIHNRISIPKNRLNNRLKTIFSLLAYLGIYGIINYSRFNSYMEGFFIPFFIGVVICFICNSENLFKIFFDCYRNIAVFISSLSLLFYIFGTLFHFIHGIAMTYTNNGWWYPGTNYYYLSFINDWQSINFRGISIVRNVGIFMEAPGFAVLLTYALWWELLGMDAPKKKNIFILLITIITTFSAKAYVATFIIILLYLYSRQDNLSRLWKRIRIALLPLLISLAAVLIFQAVRFRSVSYDGDETSFSIRLWDYIATFRAWKDHLIFGSGFYNLEKLYKYYPLERHSGTSTAGIMNILAYGGAYMFLFYLVPLARFLKRGTDAIERYRMYSFVLLIVFNLITGNTQYSYFLIFFLAFGYMMNTSKQSVETTN